VSVLAWLGASTTTLRLGSAIMQIPGRTPANTAMTAATLDLLSGGRFLLGLGTSGPQVVEGWHGQPWAKPLARTREYVEIVRAALRRETLEFHGEHYDIPRRDGTGLGKPLKLMARPLRADIPIYLAAMSPKAVQQAFEIADGWLPIFWSPERAREAYADAFALARPGFDVAASVPALVSDDVEAARDALKPYYALYIGGMGARGKNFYNELCRRYGYEAAAQEIQDLYLDGHKREAAAAVPDAFVDEVALVGSKERIADRLTAWRESGATTLLVSTPQAEAIRVLAELAL
jgi:F420-dependent oxidoreductase-like protein